ncbi:MAG: hypothetical protein CK426_06480 [Legionella sp.]|nr:MAG: hypothetical protein CK423_05975 [Legionella sp.]PJD98424.1 MAG: hypothetical protein CK426_06480 [Legionella sp.]
MFLPSPDYSLIEKPDLFMPLWQENTVQGRKPGMQLHATWIDTPLAPMVALASQESLYLLEFMTRKKLRQEVLRLQQRGFIIEWGENEPLHSIAMELKQYFSGVLQVFKTPYKLFGTSFQQAVWHTLQQIPYGETRSYAEQARMLAKPQACRAVANANGANQLAIIIPCHRVIASDGSLGGYGGGLPMKQGLLEHEKQHYWLASS